MLKIENFKKTYNGVVAVNDINLHILPGEIFGFIGHNGAGKTSTIKSCCGIIDFDEGNILINNHSIKDDPISCKMDLAYIPDNPDIYDFLSGIQYLNFISDVYRIPSNERKQKIEYYAGLFEIENDLNNYIGSLSHGMKQKLVIISALIHSPKLLIMDEPFVGLDPIATYRLKIEMKNLCNNGSSIFFSTHVLDVAEKLCDKVAIIKKGQIMAVGSVDEVKGANSLENVFLNLEENNA